MASSGTNVDMVRWSGRLGAGFVAILVVAAGLVVARQASAAAGTDPVAAGTEPAGPGSEPAASPVAPPGPRAVPAIASTGHVTVVRIDETIDLGLAAFLARIAGEQAPGDLLVLDVNTLGGRVDAALVIRDALLHVRGQTVCWVDPRAISAGALISLACDVIAVAPGATIGAATPVQLGAGGAMEPVEQKVVSYMRAEMRATAEAKGRSGEIAEAMVDADVAIPGLDDKGKLLTLDGAQAIRWGIAEVEAGDEAQLWRALHVAAPTTISRPQPSWAEELARFLSSPTLSLLLMSLGMLGILVELWSPGHGIALGVGVACLVVFFFGHHVVKLAGWEELVLFGVGVVLVGVEVFVPGHVLPGVIGALLIIASLVMALVNLDHIPLGDAWRSGRLPDALATVLGAVVVTALGMWVAIRTLPHTRLGRKLVLDAVIASPGRERRLAGFVGTIAHAATDLRPSGKVLLGGEHHDAIADGGWITTGAAVRVVTLEGMSLVVREEAATPAEPPR